MNPLNVRIAGFYFAYFGVLGAFVGYWTPYLVSRGFSAELVGYTHAMIGVSRATVPLLWGWLADRSGQRMAMIRGASIASLLTFAAIPFVDGVWFVVALTVGYTLFWNALLPQFEVVALRHMGGAGHGYARVRLWGSIGYIVALMAAGALIDAVGIGGEPVIVSGLFLAMSAVAWLVPEPPGRAAAPVADAQPAVSLAQVLRRPAVVALLIACLCSQASFQPYYLFFTVLMDAQGHARTVTGLLWSLGVTAEIGIFLVVGRLLARFPAGSLMTVVLGLTALRWLLIGLLPDVLPVLLFAQLLHAAAFGVYHALAMQYVHTLFPADQQGRGQAIYISVAYGVGGSLGALITGWGWAHLSPAAVFAGAAGVAALGSVIAWWGLVRAARAAAPVGA